ncbi:MAG: acyl-CoA dehydrogenase N-terminal domain-containing protein, partial [Pseudomonadota bacterium]|nr:acyl-CoA dehydrogenase N-terminal domain-containing protein [Pseudomonadota bacterium]
MYRAPLRELHFVLEELLGSTALSDCPQYAEYSDELGRTILEEAGRFAESVLEPLNRPGDHEGAHWGPEVVRTPATDFHFGRTLQDAVRRFQPAAVLALGGGACPLFHP